MTLTDAQLEEVGLAGLTEAVHDDRIASLVRDLQRAEQQLAALYSAHNLLTFGLPLVAPPLDLLPPASKVSLLQSLGRLLSAALRGRPVAVQVDPRSAEEWRIEKQLEHVKLTGTMKRLQISARGLLQVDLTFSAKDAPAVNR